MCHLSIGSELSSLRCTDKACRQVVFLQSLLDRAFLTDFGKLRANREELWTSRLPSYLSSLRHLRFLLHCVNSLASDAEFKLT